jgi:hypothetical protein
MRVRLLISKDKQDSAHECLKAVFAMLDRLVKVKMSAQTRDKCERTRRKADLVKNKEKEEERAQKAALQQREEERKYPEKLKALPPAEQQRLEEKRRQQELKAQKKKM